MDQPATPEGTTRIVDGQSRVYHDGYWIKQYAVPADTLAAKKRLIEALTRRLFNHVEYGINIPGTRLDEARRAYDAETEPRKKRVKGAMLAGALFNRAADVFTKAVELQALGVEIRSDNALLHECGEHLREALRLGTMVLHRSGEEGIDELWGEPLKAFAFPIEAFYRSRYVKIAGAMRGIDENAAALEAALGATPLFAGIEAPIREFASWARVKSETLQTDAEIFDVWASFVASAERLSAFAPRLSPGATTAERLRAAEGMQLLAAGRELISSIARARVAMPKSTHELCERCRRFREGTPPADRDRDAPARVDDGAPSLAV